MMPNNVIVLAVLSGFICGLPHIIDGLFMRNPSYTPFYMTDEFHYGNQIRTAAQGDLNFCLYEYRTTPTVWPEKLPSILALFVKIGIRVEYLVIAADFIFPVFWFLVAYALLSAIGMREPLALFLATVHTLEFSLFNNWIFLLYFEGLGKAMIGSLLPGFTRYCHFALDAT